jgi:hypothetical protein
VHAPRAAIAAGDLNLRGTGPRPCRVPTHRFLGRRVNRAYAGARNSWNVTVGA